MIKPVDRADGRRFQVYGKRDGKKVYVGTFASRKEAIAADEDHRAQQRRIAAGELPPQHDEKRTLGAALEKWTAMLAETGSRSEVGYESRVRNHLIPAFGGVSLHELTKVDVARWRDKLSLEMAPNSVNACLGALSSAYTWFIDQRWVERNPCQRVKALVRPAKVFPWLMSGELVTRLISHCLPSIRDIVAVLVGTGMRLDEALHLHWDDVDLEHRLIAVRRGRKGVPKSGKMRHIPIMDSVMPVLRAMRLARGGAVMLWPGRKPGKARAQNWIWRAFKKAVRAAKLDERMRVHDLRHSFASLFLLDGGDIFKLSKILGHSSVTITERTYAHLRPDAFEEDYGRVRFAMPGEAKVVELAKHR